MADEQKKQSQRIPKELVEVVAECEAKGLLRRAATVDGDLYFPIEYLGITGAGMSFLAIPLDKIPEEAEAPMAIPAVYLVLPFDAPAAYTRFMEAEYLTNKTAED